MSHVEVLVALRVSGFRIARFADLSTWAKVEKGFFPDKYALQYKAGAEQHRFSWQGIPIAMDQSADIFLSDDPCGGMALHSTSE